MLSMNIRKNLKINKIFPFRIHINKYNKLSFKNLFSIQQNESFIKGSNKNIGVSVSNRKYFSNNFSNKKFEDFSIENDDGHNKNKSSGKNFNLANKERSKASNNQNIIINEENKNETYTSETDLETKYNHLLDRVNKSFTDFNKFNLQEKNNKKEELKFNNLDKFKQYILSTINLPKTDFNERLIIGETEINNINKITEDYYIKQLGIFQKASSYHINEEFNQNLSKENITIHGLNKKNKLWISHDVPTSATGKPNYNQILNKVIKDATHRLKNLQGYRVMYKQGFEAYGMNIENYIFAKHNKRKFKTLQELLDSKFAEVSNQYNSNNAENHREEFLSFTLERSKALFFREQCRKYIEEYIFEQKEYYKRMGIMSYYNYSYSTFEKFYEKKVMEFFKDLYEKGLIYRDYRKVLWSTETQRILGYEEIEEKSELNDSLIIKFPLIELSNDLKQIQALFPNKTFFFLGFLTEPPKYIGVQALSINDNADYCIAELSSDLNELYICSYKRLPEICKRAKLLKNFKVHFVAKGWAFKNLIAKDLVFERKLPIISNDNVSVFFGTGLNLICPAHDNYSKDEEENHIARKYNLSMKGYIDENNNFCKSLGLYFHNTYYHINGNKKIIDKLKSKNALILSYEYENMYYTSKKSGERISIRTIPSWFLKIDENLKNKCLKELSMVKFHPELNFDEMKNKNQQKKKELNKMRYMPQKRRKMDKEIDLKDYFNVVEELDSISEWCISEINSWGIPIPQFVNVETKEIVINSDIIDHVKNLFDKHGSDIWFSWDVKDLLPDSMKKDSHLYKTGKENFDYIFNNAISWFGITNFTEQELEVLKDFENLRNIDYIRNITNEFSDLKYDLEQEIRLKRSFVDSGSSDNISQSNSAQKNMQATSEFESFEKELFKTENLNLNMNFKNDFKRLNNKISTESEKEYTDFSSGVHQFLDNNPSEKEHINSLSDTKSNLKNVVSEDEESDLIINNLINSENVKELKQIIPKPVLLEHISKKTKTIILKNQVDNNINDNFCIYDMIIEGKNQHSLWLLMSTLTSVSKINFNVFKNVLTHGYILDSRSREISEHNFKDALDIVDGTVKRFSGREYGTGADSLRLYFLKNCNDVDFKLFEEDILKAKSELKNFRKIAKTCLGLLNDYDTTKIDKTLIDKIKVNIDELDLIDQIMYYEFVKYVDQAYSLIENYDFSKFLKYTTDFMNKIFRDYYLDSAKFIIINYNKDDFRRLIKQFILKEIFYNLTKLLYPIIPFNTEDIYSHMYFLKDKNSHLGFEEFIKLDEIKSKLNFQLTDFQRVNYEFKAKSLLEIKNKFLYLFNVVVEKSVLKNKLSDGEYYNHLKEQDDFLQDDDNLNFNRLEDVEKKYKQLEDKKRKKLKVNLIENDFDRVNHIQKDIMLYNNSLQTSNLVNYESRYDLIIF